MLVKQIQCICMVFDICCPELLKISFLEGGGIGIQMFYWQARTIFLWDFCSSLEVVWPHCLSGVLSVTKSSHSLSPGFVVVPMNYGMWNSIFRFEYYLKPISFIHYFCSSIYKFLTLGLLVFAACSASMFWDWELRCCKNSSECHWNWSI